MSKNGLDEEITVKEAENGYVICHTKSGYKDSKNGKEYFCDEKKYVSKENPLEEEEETSFSDALGGILDEIAEEDGMINVKG